MPPTRGELLYGNGTKYRSLEGRTVFISGGSSGVGADLVRAFAAQGARVALFGARAGGGDELIEERERAAFPTSLYQACDVRDIEALQHLLGKVADEWRPIRVLVNTAGRDDRHCLNDLTPAYWDDCLNVNSRHQVFATQAVAAQLRGAILTGSMINMGSISWMRGRPNLTGYAASRAATSGMTRTLARELGEAGTRLSALVPGAIATERQAQLWRSPKENRRFIELQCLKFRSTPVTSLELRSSWHAMIATVLPAGTPTSSVWRQARLRPRWERQAEAT